MQVKISQAVRMIEAALKAKVVPMLKGSPASGKSQIVHQIAERYNLELIDLRLSQCDPTDLAGFPSIHGAKADYLPMAHFPIRGDALPPGKAGWLLFLDEATSAMQAIQAAAYKLVLDRMVGTHHLHEKCLIVLAGNLETDGAIVHPMSTALQSRLMHLELEVDVEEWLLWADTHDIDFRITSFIRYKPDVLYNFSADHTDCTYAAPRTWEFTDRIIKVIPPSDPDCRPMLAGTIGEGVASEFIVFCKIHEELLKPAQIVAAPETVAVPTQPSILFALTGSIANHIKPDNGDAYMKFVKRLPVEFQVVCLRETVRRNMKMMSHASVQSWIKESGNAHF